MIGHAANSMVIPHFFEKSGTVSFTVEDKDESTERRIVLEVFSAWLTQDLIPKLPEKNVVVMDNATFHKREDIQTAKENTFGRKIFETFAAEFMSSYLNEGTEVAKLNKAMDELQVKLSESEAKVAEKEVQLQESARDARIKADVAERKAVMQEMMAPLNKQQKEIMGALLESTQTDKLQSAFNKYLPSVLKEDAKKPEKKVLSESSKEITGNKEAVTESAEAGQTAEIINLRKLAGIS